MQTVRETYDLPERAPVPYRQYGVMVAIPIALILAWLLLPSSPVVVAILAVLTLAAVFAGVRWVLASRQFHEAPGHNPVSGAPGERRN